MSPMSRKARLIYAVTLLVLVLGSARGTYCAHGNAVPRIRPEVCEPDTPEEIASLTSLVECMERIDQLAEISRKMEFYNPQILHALLIDEASDLENSIDCRAYVDLESMISKYEHHCMVEEEMMGRSKFPELLEDKRE